jgi:hypothetical protein
MGVPRDPQGQSPMLEVSLFSEVLSDVSASADAPTALKLLYTRRESSFALGLSIRSIDILVATKQLAIRKVGRRILITASSLESFAQAEVSAQ